MEFLKTKNYIQITHFSLQKKIICKMIKTKREELITTGKQNYFGHVMHFKFRYVSAQSHHFALCNCGMSAYK